MSDDLSGFSLMELFRTEAESQVAVLTEGLLALENQEATAAVIEPLMRAAHSLKGAARIVNLGPAERLAHAMEDVFVAAQKGKIRLDHHAIDHLLQCVDRLSEISKLEEADVAAWEQAHAAGLDCLIAGLNQIEAGQFKGPAPEAQREAAGPGTAPAQSAEPPQAVEPEPSGATPGAPADDSVIARPPSPPPAPAQAESAPPAAATPRVMSGEGTDRVVRVTADNLNRLMGLAGESLVQARQLRPLVDSLQALKRFHIELWDEIQTIEDLVTMGRGQAASHELAVVAHLKSHANRGLADLSSRIERLESHARRSEELSERLHQEVISSRLRPMIDGIRGFPRLVRDLARQTGKQIRFEIVGEQTGVDRDILEKLEAPLNHLIRNAIDHGIELPEERSRQGKDPVASLKLEARHVAGMLQLTLCDDGRGIDPEKIRTRIVEREMVSPAMAAQLTAAELFEFLFLAGFSTRSEVTNLSGRGVGLDVVQSMAQTVGGSTRVTSRLGEGTCFSMQLPITMSVIRALLVRVGGEAYAFPLSRLDRIETVPRNQVRVLEGRDFFTLDDESVGLVAAAEVLELPHSQAASDEPFEVIVLSDRGQTFGIAVDAIQGERDLDVRPLDRRLGRVPDINSASVLEDGQPVLIIDVEDMVRSIDNLVHNRRLRVLPSALETAAARIRVVPRILVVDDSITVRELERQLLESRGFKVDTAVDGVDGWNAVRTGGYDLVVSDVDMPRMDGIQLVKQIRQEERLARLPIVIVSYKDREEDRLRGLDAGASCYLTKSSFHDDTFLQKVVDLLGEAD